MTRRLAAGLSAAVVVALAALFAWRLVTLYAAGGEPDPLEAPALAAGRALLADALRGDSAGVAARVGSAQPVAWLETALRHDSALVRAWAAGEPRFGRTLHRGDTTVVSWSTYDAGERCLGGDVWVALLDVPRAPRVVRLSSPCVEEAPITFEVGGAGGAGAGNGGHDGSTMAVPNPWAR